ncbi:MAG TPA: di-heme oxidoredictase family protein [Marinagarivorans sp.]
MAATSATLVAYSGLSYSGEQKTSDKTTQAFQFSDAGIRLVNEDIYVPFPPEGKKTPQREPDVDQTKLLNGHYSLGYVLEAGQNQFNLPFTAEHGHGEGAKGPRHLQRKVWNARGGTVEDPAAWPFLRVNGIDSQSCFECHNTIGEYTPEGSKTTAKVRKPSAQGGPAGAANTAFINDQFPEHLSQLLGDDPATKAVLTKFARNPPHVLGTGYTQRLATEMTTELQAQAEATKVVAQRNLNTTQTIALNSKGVDFGRYSITCSSNTSCTPNTSDVVGVQQDLVIRPFQWGGIASSVRHFARDALDFHFSVQAVEKVGHKDCDLDGLSDEITVGNVTALTSYVAMFRPPNQVIEPGKEDSVAKGEKLLDKIGCTSCHSPSMTIDNPTLTINTPPPVSPSEACPREVAQLTNSLGHISDSALEANKRVSAVFSDQKIFNTAPENTDAPLKRDVYSEKQKSLTPDDVYNTVFPFLHDVTVDFWKTDNFQIDLNLTGIAKDSVPAYVWPRLPSDGKSVNVPLFSDLKLHYMGQQLSDDYAQPTDNAEYSAQPGYYVTRVLWGVGDTDPYMHDGRARTLRDAIELHGVEGSEAQDAARKFAKLSASRQQNIIDFLESLKLPIAEGVTAPEYVK